MTPLKPAAIRIGKNETGNRTGISLIYKRTNVCPISGGQIWSVVCPESHPVCSCLCFRLCVCGPTLRGTGGKGLEKE